MVHIVVGKLSKILCHFTLKSMAKLVVSLVHLQRRVPLACLDNKIDNTHTDMITHTWRRRALCCATTGHVGSIQVLPCVLRSSLPDDYRYVLSVVELAPASSGQDLIKYYIQIDEHSRKGECHETKT